MKDVYDNSEVFRLSGKYAVIFGRDKFPYEDFSLEPYINDVIDGCIYRGITNFWAIIPYYNSSPILFDVLDHVKNRASENPTLKTGVCAYYESEYNKAMEQYHGKYDYFFLLKGPASARQAYLNQFVIDHAEEMICYYSRYKPNLPAPITCAFRQGIPVHNLYLKMKRNRFLLQNDLGLCMNAEYQQKLKMLHQTVQRICPTATVEEYNSILDHLYELVSFACTYYKERSDYEFYSYMYQYFDSK